jgi:hypothetical protein
MLALLAPAAMRAGDSTGDVSLESEFRFAMVGSSHFKEGRTTGDISALDYSTRDVLSIKAHEGFLIRFGFEFERYNFGRVTNAPLPSKLQSIDFVVGTDIQLGDAWIVRIEATPGFYGANKDLRARNIDVPVVIGASYFVSPDFQIAAGLSIDPERKYPVLPGLGFRYKCSADWVLDMILPTPRIEYNFNKSLLFYAGADLRSTSYRMEGDFGTAHGDPRLNNAIVDYEQIHLGAGASWKINSALTFEIEGGVVPIEDFDFHRAEIHASATDIPPYGGVLLRAAF